jgi:hypothetical protein
MTREDIEHAAWTYKKGQMLGSTDLLQFAIEQVNAALEEAAKITKESKFVDGPNGTIEGQIAEAIRVLTIK